MNTVWVFKTTVENNQQVNQLKPLIDELVKNNASWNFDLEDCDHILRIAAAQFDKQQLQQMLKSQGIVCDELID